MVKESKKKELKKRMDDLGIFEKDLEEKFILGSGKGGQKLQKTFSCVYLKHIPTNLEVKLGKDRSREVNRFLARKRLCELFEEKILGKKPKIFYKIKKQKERRTRKSKKKYQ
jgi:protein subunit release factor B